MAQTDNRIYFPAGSDAFDPSSDIEKLARSVDTKFTSMTHPQRRYEVVKPGPDAFAATGWTQLYSLAIPASAPLGEYVIEANAAIGTSVAGACWFKLNCSTTGDFTPSTPCYTTVGVDVPISLGRRHIRTSAVVEVFSLFSRTPGTGNVREGLVVSATYLGL